MGNDRRPDALDKGIRFGCGFLAGALIAFFILIQMVAHLSGAFWVAVVGSALVFAFIAMRYGDGAWEALVRFLRWW